MRLVADKLAEWAINEPNESNADAFGRSAFNRYYYASYLITRQMLNYLDTAWTRIPHANIPELLENTVIKKIRKELKQKEKAGLIARGEVAKFRRVANTSVSELSNVLKIAYNLRVIADYEPETRIVRQGRKIRLANETLTGAQNWTQRVSQYTKSLLSVWRQLGIS